ncbi:hypothetical protein Pan44_00020 [Caulifigura coniformis]|uniref:Uncharacterized protein n=1 Tax=Caulifigura coniformis TaxID=2527983 RepID=A0A517S794_9PLAN|nr:hypothetical protein Pan44_00020 [Caulifigura coniformis]
MWKTDSPAAKVYDWPGLASMNDPARRFDILWIRCQRSARTLMTDGRAAHTGIRRVDNPGFCVVVSTVSPHDFDAAYPSSTFAIFESNWTGQTSHAAVPFRLRRRQTWSNCSRSASSSVI